MYGDTGLKLVNDAKRIQALPNLPPYQTSLVREVVTEVRGLDKHITATLAPYGGAFVPTQNPVTASSILVDHLCMRRNKRCLLAYHKVRTDRLEQICWQGRDSLVESHVEDANATGPDGQPLASGSATSGSVGQDSLSPEEEEYVRHYGDLLAAYKGNWTDIDLTGSLEPPKDLFIDVRVLKDAGEIQTEYGEITLTKNSQFYVRHGDVERLIAQGYLQRLS